MCDCKEKLEAKYLELFKKKQAGADEHKAELAGYGFALNRETGVVEMAPYMPVSASYLHTFKNGNQKTKKLTDSLFFNYCPFCGEKIREGVKVPATL